MQDSGLRIMVVEDDPPTRRFLADNLCADGYELLEAACLAEANRLLEGCAADLMLVDLGLPDGDGLELVRKIRDCDGIATRVNPGMPVLVLTGRGTELDRLRGFERGADDYLVKPFSYPELLARVRALLRRTSHRRGHGRIRVGALELDPASREVWVEGEPVALSKKEFALLRALAAEPTRVCTREELLRGVWGYRSICPTRTVDTHAHRLRTKLNRGSSRFVINVWGVGYRLVDGDARG
jgi:DNA-binding response OmpR family regulator